MKHAKAALIALVLIAAGAWLPAQTTDREVDDFVRAFIKRHAVPSAAIAVVRHGRVLKAAGYGTANLELDVAATGRTLYEIGSITKQFTAEAIMMLVEDGKLALDDRIATCIPDLPAAWSAITIRHLVSHTSGLHDWEAGSAFSYRREYTPREFIELVAHDPLDFPPGDRYAYTNSSHPLLGVIIERVSGKPYEQFVTERIFKPAGMTETRFRHPEEIVPRRAGGYVDKAGTLQNAEPLRPHIIAPNGGIMSSAADMAKWQIALGSGALIRNATFDRMVQPIRLRDDRPFNNVGLAWFIESFRGHRYVLHNGSTAGGYSSVVYRYLDDGLAVIVLMNVDRWNIVNVLATRVANLYVPGLDISAIREAADPDPAMSRRFADMLGAIGVGRDSDLLEPSLRNPGKAPRVPATFGHAGEVTRFAFLDREDLGERGLEWFGTTLRWLYRYKLVSRTGTTYYTFRVTPAGKVANIVPEPE